MPAQISRAFNDPIYCQHALWAEVEKGEASEVSMLPGSPQDRLLTEQAEASERRSLPLISRAIQAVHLSWNSGEVIISTPRLPSLSTSESRVARKSWSAPSRWQAV